MILCTTDNQERNTEDYRENETNNNMELCFKNNSKNKYINKQINKTNT